MSSFSCPSVGKTRGQFLPFSRRASAEQTHFTRREQVLKWSQAESFWIDAWKSVGHQLPRCWAALSLPWCQHVWRRARRCHTCVPLPSFCHLLIYSCTCRNTGCHGYVPVDSRVFIFCAYAVNGYHRCISVTVLSLMCFILCISLCMCRERRFCTWIILYFSLFIYSFV